MNIKRYLIILILLCVISMIKSNKCRILTLSGGGAHGAYQAGVLKMLHDTGHSWDVITGISVGSLNGVFLSAYSMKNQSLAVNELKNFWFDITNADIYKKNWNPIWSRSVYDNNPLNHTIHKILQNFGINNGIIKRDILVGSTRVNDGILDIFNRTDMNSVDDIVDILMASTAIPIYFPPKKYKGYYYMDGGLYTNELIYPAVRLCRKQGLNDIIIDVIRCSRPITNISSEKISHDNIFKLAYRTYEIASNTLFHHELYSTCDTLRILKSFQMIRTYPMYVYQPNHDFPSGLLDFDHTVIKKTFNMGYNNTNPIKMKWCH